MYQNYEKLRDERGLTDYKVAAETGISQVTLSDWKHGLYTPKLDKLLAIAKLFDVPITALINDDPAEQED